MQQSRLHTFCQLQSVLDIKDQIPHNHCTCIHCINNTKPLPPIIAPRFTSQKEKQIINSKAYQLVLKEATKGFSGKCQIPDVFFLGDASLIYQSKTNGKPKLKERQTNIEIKKHFQQQRKRVGITASFINNSIFTITQSQGQSSFLSSNKSHQKEIALLAYYDGTQQILSDTLLSKMLDKRKNDPIWEGVSHVMLIPPEIKHPIQQFSFHYIRSTDTLPHLTPIMDKIAENIDNLQQTQITGTKSKNIDEKLRFLQLSSEQQMIMSVNPQNKMASSFGRKTKSMMIPKKRSSLVFMSEIALKEAMKIACLEIVAYIEVSSFNRILQADFDFFSDGSKLFVHNIRNFIYEQLEDNQLTIVHDRYKPLEQISLKDIAISKQKYDKIQEQQLWNICTAVVKECLEFRKVQLKLSHYIKPSEQTLLGIFMKIYPDFVADKIFKNINWKNQLDNFITQIKTKVSTIIRQDEGIRILRRFGIDFKRTFH